MNWKNYSTIDHGSHAFLSPSKHYWINYDDDKLKRVYENYRKAALGTELHDLASRLIKNNVRLPDTPLAFNAFVNDAIGYRMKSEVVLYSSPYCYGTADAISFREGILRIHDLKTGKSLASMNQLMVYAALFLIDYEINPSEIVTVLLRIYQEEQTIEYDPEIKDVYDIVDKIKVFEKVLATIDDQ